MSTMKETYGQFRNAGYTAAESIRNARILELWKEYESNEENPFDEGAAVRLRQIQIGETDAYGKPEGYVNVNGHRVTAEQEEKELVQFIDTYGCWTLVSEYWDGEQWHMADSIGMCVYKKPLSPFENCYVPDLMRAALEALEALPTAAACQE